MSTTPPTEPPETPPTVAQELLALLKLEGVDRVFGIPGGALISMLAALKADGDITYHTCRQETGAAFMADGYSRIGGGLAVVLVTSGPGATNALTGAMNADASHTPMLVITGEVAEKFFGLGFLQEGADADLDIVAVYGGALGYSELITSPTNFRELFESAMRTAWGTPRRAAHLSLPGDVAGSPAAGFTLPADDREVSSHQQLRGRRRRCERGGCGPEGEATAADARKGLSASARGRRPARRVRRGRRAPRASRDDEPGCQGHLPREPRAVAPQLRACRLPLAEALHRRSGRRALRRPGRHRILARRARDVARRRPLEPRPDAERAAHPAP